MLASEAYPIRDVGTTQLGQVQNLLWKGLMFTILDVN